MLDTTNAVIASIVGGLAIVGAIGGWWYKRGRPMATQAGAVSEAILGRPEVRDRSGAVIQPAQPGMPAQVAALAEAVKELADTHRRVDRLEARVDEHDVVLGLIQQARKEQVVAKAEQANMWAAVEAAHKNDPNP